jgi:2-polyprenyl-3-methyl-5-hydroxy-6-metoxy-1,4-benzoquinol methylase
MTYHRCYSRREHDRRNAKRYQSMKCPICGNESKQDQLHPEVILFHCGRCKHRFSQMRPGVAAEPYSAEYYEKTHRNWFAHPDLNLFEQIAKRIDDEPRPKSLIDVGCGNGNLLHFLADRHSRPMKFTGIDLSANRSTPKIEFIQADVFSTDIERQFSIVVSLATIEHVADIRSFIQRLRALTTPNGLAIVMTLNDTSLLYKTARMLRRRGISIAFDRLYSRHHLHHFSRQSLARLLETEGLRPEATILHNPPLAAVDIPVSGGPGRTLIGLVVATLNFLAALSGQSYLQTVFCRRVA